MAKKKKRKNSLKDRMNNWRQKEYLRIGVVMLPDLKTEREAINNLIQRGELKEGDVL